MPPRRRKRLDPASFDLPVEKLRAGAFTDRPSLRTRELLQAEGQAPRVMVQLSSAGAGIVGGTDEAIALLRLGCDDWSALVVHSLYDGDRVDASETMMTIEGRYDQFAHLEPLVAGVLARRTRVSSMTRRLADAARPKQLVVTIARHDHWTLQAGDTHAIAIGGGFAAAEDMALTGRAGPRVAMMPHALIAATAGDTVAAARRFAAHVGEATEIIVPVDYANDATRTAVEVARALPGRLWGVRLATSEYLVDRSIVPLMGAFPPTGVNPQLVWNVRNALDAEGLGEVRILASGQFTVERIRHFEEEGVPVDAYGVGAALLGGRFGVAADVVEVDGKAEGRAGRELRPNAKMERVK